MGDHFLHFGRILRRGKNVECAELAGPGDGGLRLEVEVILPAVDPRSLQDVVGGGERRVDVSASDAPRRADELPAPFRFADGEDRVELLDVDLDRFLCRGDRFSRLRGDHHDRLANEGDLAFGEQNLIFDDRAEEVVLEIAKRVEAHDAGNLAGRGGVEGADASVRDRRPEEVDEQFVPRERRVVDIDRLARDIAASGVMRDVLADSRHGKASCQNFDRIFSASCSR